MASRGLMLTEAGRAVEVSRAASSAVGTLRRYLSVMEMLRVPAVP
jgi:hypothetical protein